MLVWEERGVRTIPVMFLAVRSFFLRACSCTRAPFESYSIAVLVLVLVLVKVVAAVAVEETTMGARKINSKLVIGIGK